MSSYHGWTHAPKWRGGTDPIPGANVRARGKITSNKTIASGSLLAITGGTTATFDEELIDDTADAVFAFSTVSGQGRGIRVDVDGLYTVLCRVVCGSLATPFIIDFNHFQGGDLTYELYSYPTSVDQIAVDFRLAGFACLTQRIEAPTVVVPMMVHTAGANRTIVEGSFFEVIRHDSEILSTDDLSWP